VNSFLSWFIAYRLQTYSYDEQTTTDVN